MMYVDFSAGDKDYKLRLATRNIVALEKAIGCNPLSIFGKGDELPSITTMVMILWQSLQKFHHNIGLNEAYDIFDGYMKQFIYRYLILLEKWQGRSKEVKWEKYKEDEDKVPEFDYVEEFLFDGTHDKLHDGGLLKYHQAGKPKKLAIKWHIGKYEYSAYFWFEEEPIREVFDKFYGAHPDTKTDFIIRIDAENRKYELALYRYGLKEPQIIPENVYQLLVFKNKFEHLLIKLFYYLSAINNVNTRR